MSSATAPEIVFSKPGGTSAFSRGLATGKLRKLGFRLYTSNITDPPEQVIKRNLWAIVAGYFPDALVCDRTALELAPATDGSVFVIAGKASRIELPGVILRSRRGVGPLPGDYNFRDGVSCTSFARAYLENMTPTRSRKGVARTLKRAELEGRLENLLRSSGVESFNRTRDQVRSLAKPLGMEAEARELDLIMGALLGTKVAALSNPVARARERGEPVDPRRVALFQGLHDALRRLAPMKPFPDWVGPEGWINRAFYESYFSNFIEGTEFELDEAVDIIFNGNIPVHRPADAKDIIGTYALVSDPDEMRRVPKTFEDFEALLRGRHATIMTARNDKHPGQYKRKANRAGATSFVRPEDVTGTLKSGFALYRNLDDPFHRAVFMKFLISEVHPFDDGNGRLSRVMMNAELVSAGQHPIIVPTVYRNNYLSALGAMSHHGEAEPIIKVLRFAQRYVAALPWDDFESATAALRNTNAFVRPEKSDEEGLLLRLPSAADAALV